MHFKDCAHGLDLQRLTHKLRFIYSICGGLSIFFLLVTLFFYLTLPDLGNFQGRIICCYVVSIIMTTLLLLVSYNVSLDDDDSGEFFLTISDDVCKVSNMMVVGSSLNCNV